MNIIKFTISALAIFCATNAFAYNDNNPGDDWSTCSPGFSRDVFGDCQPDYTFPGGVGHDDYGNPKTPVGPSPRHSCYSKDGRGHRYVATSRSLRSAQKRALNGCMELSSRPRSCYVYSCN